MGVALTVDSPITDVQLPINPSTDNTILNTGSVPVLLCEDEQFGSASTYVLASGVALPWAHKTCWAKLAKGTTISGSLWVAQLLFYGTGLYTPAAPTVAASELTSTSIVIPAPDSGSNYLFGADLFSSSQGQYAAQLYADGIMFATLGTVSSGSLQIDHLDLQGYRVHSAVTQIGGGGIALTTIRYTPGP
jgi:hypothetical protein